VHRAKYKDLVYGAICLAALQIACPALSAGIDSDSERTEPISNSAAPLASPSVPPAAPARRVSAQHAVSTPFAGAAASSISSASSESSGVKTGDSLAYLLSTIAMTGWAPTKTRLFYIGEAPPAVGNVEYLPLTRLDDADPQHLAILQEFQCQSLAKREYQRGQRHILVQAYCFNSSDGAYGAYNLLRQGASTVVTRGDASSEDDQSISFWKGDEFIEVYGTSEDDDESKEAVRSLADQIEHVITGRGSLPSAVAHLPVIDRVRGTEKLVMGPASVRRFFPAPYIGALQFDNARGGAVADYKFESPYPDRLKLLCLQYNNDASATRALTQYVSQLQGAKHVPSETGTVIKLDRGFLLCQARGPELIIITGARKKFSAEMLARQVY
jgi:hypothetical protein